MALNFGAFMIKMTSHSGIEPTLEKTHIFFCKHAAGINKRYPNTAARNELGKLPFKLYLETSIINFWNH